MRAVKHKTAADRLSSRYRKACERYFRKGPGASIDPAVRLGRQAVALGLETLDLARFHRQAMIALISPEGSSRARRRMLALGDKLFAAAIVPIEHTHRAALKADAHIHSLNRTLRRRTTESLVSTRRLKQSIARRRAAEATLLKSAKQRARLLQESRRLQGRLRRQTRHILMAQENERRKMSLQLHNEIAQLLLGIHVRLLAVNASVGAKTTHMEKQIAETQQLVQTSAGTIRRLAHEFDVYHDEA